MEAAPVERKHLGQVLPACVSADIGPNGTHGERYLMPAVYRRCPLHCASCHLFLRSRERHFRAAAASILRRKCWDTANSKFRQSRARGVVSRPPEAFQTHPSFLSRRLAGRGMSRSVRTRSKAKVVKGLAIGFKGPGHQPQRPMIACWGWPICAVPVRTFASKCRCPVSELSSNCYFCFEGLAKCQKE